MKWFQVFHSNSFIYIQLKLFQVLGRIINNSIKHYLPVCTLFKWSNTYIWLIDRTPSSATSPIQSGPLSIGNEGVLQIPQSSTEPHPQMT